MWKKGQNWCSTPFLLKADGGMDGGTFMMYKNGLNWCVMLQGLSLCVKGPKWCVERCNWCVQWINWYKNGLNWCTKVKIDEFDV